MYNQLIAIAYNLSGWLGYLGKASCENKRKYDDYSNI